MTTAATRTVPSANGLQFGSTLSSRNPLVMDPRITAPARAGDGPGHRSPAAGEAGPADDQGGNGKQHRSAAVGESRVGAAPDDDGRNTCQKPAKMKTLVHSQTTGIPVRSVLPRCRHRRGSTVPRRFSAASRQRRWCIRSQPSTGPGIPGNGKGAVAVTTVGSGRAVSGPPEAQNGLFTKARCLLDKMNRT
jgi:hypothetical protein